MMLRTLGVLAVSGLVAATCVSEASAQGRSSGLNRAAQAGGRGPGGAPGGAGFNRPGGGPHGVGNQGMNRVDPNVAHGPAGASRGSVAKSPSASGLSHGLKGRGNGRAPETASSETRGQDNPERIRDQRLEQADHLRQVGERNGNERLNTTADRMQANAQKQYVRQAGNVAPVDGTTNVPPAANLGDSKGQTAPTSSRTPAASTPATSGRPSWLPTWLRGPGAK